MVSCIYSELLLLNSFPVVIHRNMGEIQGVFIDIRTVKFYPKIFLSQYQKYKNKTD